MRAAALRRDFRLASWRRKSGRKCPGPTSGGGHGDGGGQVGTGSDTRGQEGTENTREGLGGCGCGPERGGGLGNAGEVGGTRRWCARGHPALSGTEFTAGTAIKYLIIDKQRDSRRSCSHGGLDHSWFGKCLQNAFFGTTSVSVF